jgi:hypothetical protein
MLCKCELLAALNLASAVIVHAAVILSTIPTHWLWHATGAGARPCAEAGSAAGTGNSSDTVVASLISPSCVSPESVLTRVSAAPAGGLRAPIELTETFR